jgi:serine O-acetyltransferase
MLHGVDLYYEIGLPDIWGAERPLGSLMGRAEYSDYFFFYQGCTVGGSGGKYPSLGENVLMYSNCSILGDSRLGNNVILGAGTQIIDSDIPDNSLVFGRSPNLTVLRKDKSYMLEKTSGFWRWQA